MRPLEDIRIIAIEQFGAGPFGSVQLADLGADVIKIEDPGTGGDVGRYVPPFQHDEHSLFFETFNRNKRSLSLDITCPSGRRVLEDLVAVADAVVSNLRGDVPAKIGIRYQDLRHINPRIVCVSLTGFGMTGPRSSQPGYDYILQGLCGWMSLTGEPDGPPTKSGLSLVDLSAGYVLAATTLAGIHQARRDGVGADCDISLYDTAMNLLSYPGTWVLTEDHQVERISRSSHPSIVPFQNFPTKDGWIVLGAAKEKFWERLATALGRADLLEDPRFADFDQRRLNRHELIAVLDELLQTHTTEHWVEVLAEAGVPCGPINDLRGAMNDPQTEARGLIAEVDHPHYGTVRSVLTPMSVGPRPDDNRRAPLRNEHADEILGELLGYDDQTRVDLEADGAFG